MSTQKKRKLKPQLQQLKKKSAIKILFQQQKKASDANTDRTEVQKSPMSNWGRNRRPRPMDALISVSNSSSEDGTADHRSTLNRMTMHGAGLSPGIKMQEEPSFELQTAGDTVGQSAASHSKEPARNMAVKRLMPGAHATQYATSAHFP